MKTFSFHVWCLDLCYFMVMSLHRKLPALAVNKQAKLFHCCIPSLDFQNVFKMKMLTELDGWIAGNCFIYSCILFNFI